MKKIRSPYLEVSYEPSLSGRMTVFLTVGGGNTTSCAYSKNQIKKLRNVFDDARKMMDEILLLRE